MYKKGLFNLLESVASENFQANTEGVVTENAIMNELASYPEIDYAIPAEAVPVLHIGENYYTDINNVSHFALANDMTLTEALDAIAEACELEAGDVGVVFESDEYISSVLERAEIKEKQAKTAKAKKAIKDKAYKQIKGAMATAGKLKNAGYPVAKKCKKNCKK